MSRTYKAKSKQWWREVNAVYEERKSADGGSTLSAWPKHLEHQGYKRVLRSDKRGNPFRVWWTDDPKQKRTTHKWERRVRKQQVLREELKEIN